MAFHFPFEVLLRLRKSVERQQEMLLVALTQQMDQVQREIDKAESWLKVLSQRDSATLHEGTAASELHFFTDCHDTVEHLRQSLKNEYVKLREAHCRQRSVLEHARRDREVIEELRQRQLRTYREEEKRAEQRRLDDMFLMLNRTPR